MSAQDLQMFIQDCQKMANQLRSLAGQASGVARSTLNESVHHLEMCIKECEFAAQQIR
ncbi:hypothetical protein SAMN00808754_2095 [Thermanaeromonas toyohensis ToBE]|uniref:Uncharacterized protein n=1 Tax=Thermanaeromonas toyohensis ToBE TaxID=698762 RepID=A0A1W1VXF0_9FIRM|nr:hypothetical protein [Thermanaeromonas toyohensis]SMB98047.1 hypothetical protein SAMN00808754_2095 [Thermanaeromonas toyohensis ToBE]